MCHFNHHSTRVSNSKRIPHRARAAIGAAILAGCAVDAYAANVTNAWLTASDGTWSDLTKWSAGAVPNNAGASTFTVTIGATGSPYTLTLNTSNTVDSLTLNSA